MKDVIEKSIVVNATAQKVYQAITDPTQIVKWFPDAVEGEIVEGARPVFDFGEHGKTSMYNEAARPNEYFAYRWVPGGANIVDDVLKVANTLVEFFIEESQEGTKVTIKESGFASLPPEIAENSFKNNDGGWDYMVGRLQKYLG